MKRILHPLLLISFVISLNAEIIPEQVVSQSIAKINVDCGSGGKEVRATGFVWPDTKHIVTAFHAVALNGSITVSFDDGANWMQATVEKTLRSQDLAVLKLNSESSIIPIQPISVSADKPAVHSQVIAIGYPPGVATRHPLLGTVVAQGPGVGAENLEQLLSSDAIKDKIRTLGFPGLEQRILLLQNPLQPGMSGGPVINNEGKLVGIADGGLEMGLGQITWAIPADALTELWQQDNVETADDAGVLTVLFGAELNAANSPSKNIGPLILTKLRTRTLGELTQLNDDPQSLQQAANSLWQQISNITVDDGSSDDSGTESPQSWKFDLYKVELTNSPPNVVPAIIAVPSDTVLAKGAGKYDVIARTGDGNLLWKARIQPIRANTEIAPLAIEFETNLREQAQLPFWYTDPAWSYPTARWWPSGFSIQRRGIGLYYTTGANPYYPPPGVPPAYLSIAHSAYRGLLISTGTISLHHDSLAASQFPGNGSQEKKMEYVNWAKFVLATLACGFNDSLVMEGQSSDSHPW